MRQEHRRPRTTRSSLKRSSRAGPRRLPRRQRRRPRRQQDKPERRRISTMDDRMNDESVSSSAAMGLLDRNEVEGVLSGAFYTPRASGGVRPKPAPAERPAHYKVICISMYTDDLAHL